MLDERNTSTTPPGHEPASLDDDKLTYTLAEAASRLGISTSLAYEAAHRGELPVRVIGRRMLVPRVALLRLLEGADQPEHV
jgi:excisionase family DNA binding protein